MQADAPCICGSGQAYQDCCERYINSSGTAPTAEALMRSRYSAYVLGNEAYLLTTWHPSTRPPLLELSASPAAKWLGLKIINTVGGKEQDTEGVVEFVARYKINGRAERLHENSRFRKQRGRWLYLDGEYKK